jgi:hypothetical protein
MAGCRTGSLLYSVNTIYYLACWWILVRRLHCHNINLCLGGHVSVYTAL